MTAALRQRLTSPDQPHLHAVGDLGLDDGVAGVQPPPQAMLLRHADDERGAVSVRGGKVVHHRFVKQIARSGR